MAYSINFVHFDQKPWPELLADNAEPISERRLAELCVSSWDAWIFRTFYEFKYPVRLSNSFADDAINFCLSWSVTRANRQPDDFIVILRGDGPRSQIGNFLVSQNGYHPKRVTQSFVPHWPQPGIIPRDPDRGDRFENITFFGWPGNLGSEFHDKAFHKELEALGLTFNLPPENRREQGLFWMDYSRTDVALAVRRSSKYDLLNKPGSKLVNAWIGEVPAVLGAEHGFRELRESNLDYMEATTPDGVLQALSLLRDSPDLRRDMVESGRSRRKSFSTDVIFETWTQMIEEEIGPQFDAWRRTPYPRRLYSVTKGIIAERFIAKKHMRLVFDAPKVTSY